MLAYGSGDGAPQLQIDSQRRWTIKTPMGIRYGADTYYYQFGLLTADKFSALREMLRESGAGDSSANSVQQQLQPLTPEALATVTSLGLFAADTLVTVSPSENAIRFKINSTCDRNTYWVDHLGVLWNDMPRTQVAGPDPLFDREAVRQFVATKAGIDSEKQQQLATIEEKLFSTARWAHTRYEGTPIPFWIPVGAQLTVLEDNAILIEKSDYLTVITAEGYIYDSYVFDFHAKFVQDTSSDHYSTYEVPFAQRTGADIVSDADHVRREKFVFEQETLEEIRTIIRSME